MIMVAELVQSHKVMGCNMYLEVDLLESHLDFFPKTLGAVSFEHGERFHRDIYRMNKRYQGEWSARYAGSLLLDTDRRRSRGKLQQKVIHCNLLGNVYYFFSMALQPSAGYDLLTRSFLIINTTSHSW
jgi:hypothetical protein